MHKIYADWRQVFDEYDPPRFAVAEASVHPRRRARYTAGDSLGPGVQLRDAGCRLADRRLPPGDRFGVWPTCARTGATTTWLLGCHDGPRVASRYGLPLADDKNLQRVARDWIQSDGREPTLDAALGSVGPARPSLILLALPGSTYVYQGEELGLQEVPDLPPEIAAGSDGHPVEVEKGRDGCRVPLPWTTSGPSLGFGPGTGGTTATGLVRALRGEHPGRRS